MRIGIITFHFVNNFGGALQAYALQKTIADECNASVEIIDYRHWFIRFTDTVRLFPITVNPKELKSGFKTMGQRFSRISRMESFISENCKLTRRYRSGAALRRHVPDFDKYVCGSDQIWNPLLTFGLAEPYFLGFVKDGGKKISYAPSFGSNKLVSLMSKKIKKYLSDFDAISIREQDGKALIKKHTGLAAVQLIDPVFLLKSEAWNMISTQPNMWGEVKNEYILLYIMQHDDKVYDYARRIKEKLGIQLVEISRYGYRPDFIDVSLVDVGPREFIGLFQNAAYICTNSYHGLVFSLIFEKDFCLIPCKKFYSRIRNLLRLLHIEISEVLNDNESLSACYDKESVREAIVAEREKAIRYLQSTINAEGQDKNG